MLDGALDPLFVPAFQRGAFAQLKLTEQLAAGDEGRALQGVGLNWKNHVLPRFQGADHRHNLTEQLRGQLLLSRIEDDLEERLQVGILGLLNHHHCVFERKLLHFDAGLALPIDSHDGEAIGLPKLGSQADLSAHVVGAMAVQEPA